ncbi:MAG: hypothetical protein AAFU72_07690 [Pseudomonadota bacterium]
MLGALRAVLLALLIGAVGPAGASDGSGALGYGEARALFIEGDVEGLHRRFVEHREGFGADGMSGLAFERPYYAFYVYSAVRRETIAEWRRRYPEDASAMAAEAAHHYHVMRTLSDGPFDKAVDRRRVAAARRAGALLAAAIEADPAHIHAARALYWLAYRSPGTVSAGTLAAAEQVLETHAPVAFATEWRLFVMARRGEPEGVQALCDAVAGKAPGLGHDACYGVALYHFRPRGMRWSDVLERLEVEEPARFPRMQIALMGFLNRPLDEQVAFARAYDVPFPTHELFDNVGISSRGSDAQPRDLLAEAAALDPDHPLIAPHHALAIYMPDGRGPAQGRMARMIAYDSDVGRRETKRLLAIHDFSVPAFNAALWKAVDFTLSRQSGDRLPFVERAIVESGNHPDAWLFAGRDLIDPKEWIGMGPDYRPLASFECRKRNILRLVFDACADASEDHRICDPEGLETTAAQINDIATIRELDCTAAPDLGVATTPNIDEEEG